MTVRTRQGYMGLGLLSNQRGCYQDGIFYYQEALQLSSKDKNPIGYTSALTGIALARLRQGEIKKAYAALEPLLTETIYSSFASRFAIHFAAVAYQILTAIHDPRAEAFLDRSHTLLQTELAKFADPTQRANYERYRDMHMEIITWWEAKHRDKGDE